MNNAAEGKGVTVSFPTVRFDGHEFYAFEASAAPFIYLAYRARRDDAAAAVLLAAFKVTIPTAVRGVNYWPPAATAEGAT